jgi:hypothetical protein
MTDVGMPMPALVFWMPMPTYVYFSLFAALVPKHTNIRNDWSQTQEPSHR